MLSLGARLISEVFLRTAFSQKHSLYDELQDRTIRPISVPWKSVSLNPKPPQLSARGYSRVTPCAEVRGGWGTGMSGAGSGCAALLHPGAGIPFPPALYSRSPPDSLRCVPCPSWRHRFLKGKISRLAAVSFNFQNLPGTDLALSDEGRVERGVPRTDPAQGLFPGCPRSPRTPHLGRARGPRGRTYRLGGWASRSRSQCHS